MKHLRTSTLPALALLCSCTMAHNGTRLQAGQWRGDVAYSDTRPPIGVLFDIERRDGAPHIRLVTPPAAGLDATDLHDVRVKGDTLHFTWPRRTPWRCALRDQGGYFAGACTADDGRAWTVRMASPGSDDPPLGYTAWLLARTDPGWVTHARDGVRLHVPRGAEGSVDTAAVLAAATAARQRALELLGVPAGRRVDLFVVKDRAELARLLSTTGAGTSDALGSAAIATGFGAMHTVVAHEVGHVLSWNAWGKAAEPSAWISEALPVIVAGSCGGWGITQLAQHIASRGKLLPPSALVHSFREQDDLIASLQSAGFVTWLLDRHGRDVVRIAWREGAPGLERATGRSFEALHREWEASLAERSTRADPDMSLEALYGRGCG